MKRDRITCPECGNDLGPRQPLPRTLTLCKRCNLWVDNQGRPQPRHISEILPKVMAGLAAKHEKAKRKRAKAA